MCVVQVVGRADTDVVNLPPLAPKLVHMTVESLELGEEIRFREVPVDDADAVIRVERRDQLIVGVADGLHVPRRDVAGGADQGETLARRRVAETHKQNTRLGGTPRSLMRAWIVW